MEEFERRERQARTSETQFNEKLVQSLKNLCFAIGGTHVAGWVEEAEMAAREGRIVKYER
jgi:hypothetical protein